MEKKDIQNLIRGKGNTKKFSKKSSKKNSNLINLLISNNRTAV